MRKRPDIGHTLSCTIKQPAPASRILPQAEEEQREPNLYVTFGEDENGDLLEVFIVQGKSGSDESAAAQAQARSISIALQEMTSEQVQPYLQRLIKTLLGIQGSNVRFLPGGDRVSSVPDAIARAFGKYYKIKYGQDYKDEINDKNSGME